ncbi:MAG: hypothetical protein ACRDT6_03060 [Micromonosporaceae bacterium]
MGPAELRTAGAAVSAVAGKLTGDMTQAGRNGIVPSQALRSELGAAAAVHTLATLWRNYLSGIGAKVDGHGDRLVLLAKAYQEKDEEAAEALGVDLPVDRRPGRSAW